MDVSQLDDGSLLALYRSRWADYIYSSRSTDRGRTWSQPEPTAASEQQLIHPVHSAGERRISRWCSTTSTRPRRTERRASLYDDIEDEFGAELKEPTAKHGERTAFWGVPRAPMTLAISDDGGRTWPYKRNLEVGSGYCMTNNSREQLEPRILVSLDQAGAFENIKGHPGHKALYNMIGCNLSRFCLMIGEEPVDHPLKAVQLLQKKLGRKMAPVEVPAERAICNQNIVEGDEIDIRMFPAQRMWPLDGGMYLGTADAVITKDPDTGRINVGTYRMMIKGPREIGLYTSPGKDATTDREKWWKMGKPMPIAACYGIDPLLFLVGGVEPAEDRKRIRVLFRASRARRSSCSPPTSPACRCRRMPRSSWRAISIRTRPSPKVRSASSPAITAGRAARRPTCASSGCATATTRRSARR